MQRSRRSLLLAVAVLATALAGCSQAVLEVTSPPGFNVEPVAGSDVKRITLSDEAAERVGIETEAVKTNASGAVVVPDAAVFYDAAGATWVYANPEGHVFQRVPVTVKSITAHEATLTIGPAADTNVVTVGVQELFGTETGVGEPD